MTMRVVTREEFMRRLENELEEYRMTVEEFRAEGEADTLTDGNLRDMWLMYRPVLFDDDLRNQPGSGRSLEDERDRGAGSPESACPSTDSGDRDRISETPTIRYVTREELLRRLESELEECRMTLEEFRAEGQADTLTDGNLRDLWLHYRWLLLDSDPRDGPRSHDVEHNPGSGSSGRTRPVLTSGMGTGGPR